jgi:adenosylmethionine-8-amino-7-oxononanoate aminotransferase
MINGKGGGEAPRHGGNVFPRKLDGRLIEAVKAKGVWIEDAAGKRYIDASGGPILANVGHGREEIARAVGDQIRTCDYVHGTMFTTAVVEELAQSLADHAPAGLDRFYFLSTGAEAVETAIKLARQIQIDSGRPQRFKLISRWKSYHGLTLGALSAAGRTTFRAPFAPLLIDVLHIPPPYCLRCSYGLTYPQCGLRCAHALDEAIQNLGAETISAFLAETVSGATLAACPPPPGYLKLIREICTHYGVLLILDEVMSGMGRTGRWFGCDHFDVVPDIMTMGKGMSGGAAALSAVATSAGYLEVIRKGTGNFIHGGTYSHHAVSAAAGLATIRIMEREKLVERVDQNGKILAGKLKNRLEGMAHVADIRGVGFMWGIEIVKDTTTLEPYPRREKVAERLWNTLFDGGVITYKSTGLAGTDGDALMVAPPFVIEEKEMDLVVDAIAGAIGNTLGS